MKGLICNSIVLWINFSNTITQTDIPEEYGQVSRVLVVLGAQSSKIIWKQSKDPNFQGLHFMTFTSPIVPANSTVFLGADMYIFL